MYFFMFLRFQVFSSPTRGEKRTDRFSRVREYEYSAAVGPLLRGELFSFPVVSSRSFLPYNSFVVDRRRLATAFSSFTRFINIYAEFLKTSGHSQ